MIVDRPLRGCRRTQCYYARPVDVQLARLQGLPDLLPARCLEQAPVKGLVKRMEIAPILGIDRLYLQSDQLFKFAKGFRGDVLRQFAHILLLPPTAV